MRRAIEVQRHASGAVSATVTLPFDDRHRRRIRMTDDDGGDFMLDLPDAVLLTDGDNLVLDDGGVIVVRAAEEDVADIYCDTTVTAARIAWHIGNRHTPVQVLAGGTLRIRDDHVMVDMVKGLGATVLHTMAPFEPEGGAYNSGGGHGHAH